MSKKNTFRRIIDTSGTAKKIITRKQNIKTQTRIKIHDSFVKLEKRKNTTNKQKQNSGTKYEDHCSQTAHSHLTLKRPLQVHTYMDVLDKRSLQG